MNSIDYTNDPRSVLCHFNPNHDKLGRFAKSRFGGSKSSSKTVDKTKSEEYNKDKSIDKEKLKKYAKIGAGVVAASLAVIGGVYLVKSGKLDKMIGSGQDIIHKMESRFAGIPFSDSQDTGPIHRLPKPETIHETIMNTNPHYGDPEYKGNCTKCALAAFMRSCGFDVKAGKVLDKKHGQKLAGLLSRCFDYDLVKDTVVGKASEIGTDPESVSKSLIKQFGRNASGVIGGTFKLPNGKSYGHAFNFVIKHGVVEFFDTQPRDVIVNDSWIRDNVLSAIDENGIFEAIRLDKATPIFDMIAIELET